MEQQGEMSKKRVTELENSKQRLSQHIETLEVEKKANFVEISRLKDAISELNNELNQKLENMQILEDLRRQDLEEKVRLEDEMVSLNRKIHEFTERQGKTLEDLDREAEQRHQLEKELRISKQREEDAQDRITRLVSEIEHLKANFRKEYEAEQENKNKLEQERNALIEDLQTVRDELGQLYDEKAELAEELEESQQKNAKLLDLLNQEIERQNEALNQKVVRSSRRSIVSTSDPMHEIRDIQALQNEGIYQSQFIQSKVLNSTNRDYLKRSVVESRSRPSESIIESPNKGDKNVSRAIDFTNSQVIPQETFDEKPTKESSRLLRERAEAALHARHQSMDEGTLQTK